MKFAFIATVVLATFAFAESSPTLRGANAGRDLQCTLCTDDDRLLAEAPVPEAVSNPNEIVKESAPAFGPNRGLGKKADVVSNAAPSVRGAGAVENRDLQCTLCPDDDKIPDDDYRRLADAKPISSWFGFGSN